MAAVGDATETQKDEGTDPAAVPGAVEPGAVEPDESKRSGADTLAEQQALAALDELIAKVDSGPELSGSESREREAPPPEAYAPSTSDAPSPDGWYVAMKDNAQGPLTVDQLKDLWSSGEIGADSLCWREGMGEWRPLSRLHGLADVVAPRPREGLKALSARPIARTASQPSFAPNASNMLKSLAEQEAKTTPPPPPTSPTTAPTTPSGPRKVALPAVKPPPPQSVQPRTSEEDEDEEEERPARAAGVSGGKLFLSLFAASVLGGLVGGGLVKLTIPPPPEPVVISEPPPAAPAPPPIAVTRAPPAQVAPPASAPPPPKKAEVKAEVKTETKAVAPKPPPEAPSDPSTPKKPPPPTTPPSPKTPLDKEFQDVFGK